MYFITLPGFDSRLEDIVCSSEQLFLQPGVICPSAYKLCTIITTRAIQAIFQFSCYQRRTQHSLLCKVLSFTDTLHFRYRLTHLNATESFICHSFQLYIGAAHTYMGSESSVSSLSSAEMSNIDHTHPHMVASPTTRKQTFLSVGKRHIVPAFLHKLVSPPPINSNSSAVCEQFSAAGNVIRVRALFLF